MKNFIIFLLFSSSCLLSAGENPKVAEIKQQFLELKFSFLEGDAEQEEVMRLHLEADKHLPETSDDAETLLMRARILAYHASLAGGMEGLGMVKEAKELLERSLELNPTAMDGYANTLLGILYYRVPPWPVGFKNYKKAAEHLEKAVELDPSGYEANFSLAEYLIKRKKSDKALSYLEAAEKGLKESDFAVAEKRRRITAQKEQLTSNS